MSKSISPQIEEFIKNHSPEETYLYNNRLFNSGLVSVSQYDFNHKWIESQVVKRENGIGLTQEQIDEYLFSLTSEEGIKNAYNDGYKHGYEQAIKDMQYFEETGVIIL